MTSSSSTAFNIIYSCVLVISVFTVPAFISLLRLELMYPTVYSSSPIWQIMGTSHLTYLKQICLFPSASPASPPGVSRLSKRWHNSPNCFATSLRVFLICSFLYTVPMTTTLLRAAIFPHSPHHPSKWSFSFYSCHPCRHSSPTCFFKHISNHDTPLIATLQLFPSTVRKSKFSP